ncbi:MAG: MBOAT family protein [Clostridia bacterium]|nr:MBOAT family protein [Clostridia bacterium]
MLFSSSVFICIFFPLVLFFYYVVFKKNRSAQNVFLLLASLFFYSWGEPKFVFIMIASILLNWLFALLIEYFRKKQVFAKIILTISVVSNLIILFIFKYLNFAVDNINLFIKNDIVVDDIALPIGISFFTFQAMSYVVDVYRKAGEVQKNPLNVGLYIAFFPQLIAGPIVRYQTIADQIKNRKESVSVFANGVQRFIVGFAKKIILSDTLALIADSAFNSKEFNSISFAWLGAIAYTLQIYFDFSGYSDMGIGLGKMFGFNFLENFNYPYTSVSITEFWRKWHISLGSWFKDYVYFPLGGSRVDKTTRLVFNLFCVWFLTGIWHGANWTFILWGLMYFALIVVEKITGFNRSKKLRVVKYFYTMFFVVLGWVFFRSEKVTDAYRYIKSMFGLCGNNFLSNETILYLNNYLAVIIIAAIAAMPIAPIIKKRLNALPQKQKAVADCIEVLLLTIIFVAALSYMIKGTYSPFIYFNF